MNKLEQEIIRLIEENTFLSEELKKRYIVALFMMKEERQPEYLRLIQKLDRRTKEAESGFFVLRADEAGRIKNDFDEVKRDILKKVQTKRKDENKKL